MDERQIQPSKTSENHPGSVSEHSEPSSELLKIREQTAEDASDEQPGCDKKELEKQLLEAQAQVQEYYGLLQRLQADFENYKKRIQKEREEFSRLVTESFLMNLLPVMDNFERALMSFDRASPEDVRTGVQLIYNQLAEFLEKTGVKPLDTAGSLFDPERHEALVREETSDCPDGLILEEFQKGYLFRDKVIRPSLVKVAKNMNDEKTTEENRG